MKIVDTHLHLWDLNKINLPWLNDGYMKIQNDFFIEDYLKEVDNSFIEVEKAVYIEIDVENDHIDKENKILVENLNDNNSIIKAGIIKADLLNDNFKDYLEEYSHERIKGVRHPLHVPSAEKGICLNSTFVDNISLLGKKEMIFEACMRTEELDDLVTLAKMNKDTVIVLDHVGNIDSNLISKKHLNDRQKNYIYNWEKNMNLLGELPNVICKISGLNSKNEEVLDKTVKIILNSFDESKMVFGGNYPVCNLNGSFSTWTESLFKSLSKIENSIVNKVFFKNAIRIYDL